MKKTFVITMFGKPFPWFQQYIDGVQHLKDDGWSWKIFTPHDFESKGNVEIISMDTSEFNDLVETKFGEPSHLALTDGGIPSIHVTDFYIYSGVIFEDYLKDADFWGITNMDVVYGRLSEFVPDAVLERCDVFSDDVNTVNGVFSLWRNTPLVNNLFKRIDGWRDILFQTDCKGCVSGGKEEHHLYGSDEYHMTNVLKEADDIRYMYPKQFPMLSHDRLEQHSPKPKLVVSEENGSLWELFADTLGDTGYEHARPVIGKEIIYFHFSRTKTWPLL